MINIGEWAVFNDGITVFGDNVLSYIYGKVVGHARRADDGKICGYLIEGNDNILKVEATKLKDKMPCPEPLKKWIGEEVNLKVSASNEPVYIKGVVKAVGYDEAGVNDVLYISDGCSNKAIPVCILNDLIMKDVHELVDEYSEEEMTQKDPTIQALELSIIKERFNQKIKKACDEKGISCGVLQ